LRAEMRSETQRQPVAQGSQDRMEVLTEAVQAF
jgi:hypothetical protein